MLVNELILGIETSCDETGVALVRNGELLADVTATSMDEYARFGGIIPEIASRAHLESFIPTLDAALAKAGVTLAEVDAVAATAGPGLIGPLIVGVSAAKSLALALNKPFYGVNHIIGHIAVDSLVHGPFPQKFVGLVVSGGHSHLMLINNIATDVQELGGTLDDAAGEAFDKVGRLLGLPYPGGPHIDRLARQGNPHAIRFPRALRSGKNQELHKYDYSFSGLKTAVARHIEGLEARGEDIPKADIAAGFTEAVVGALMEKAITACLENKVDTLVIGGGFSANSRLREIAEEAALRHGLTVRIPPIRYCTDNGAMIAALGWHMVANGVAPSPLDISVDTALPRETTILYS